MPTPSTPPARLLAAAAALLALTGLTGCGGESTKAAPKASASPSRMPTSPSPLGTVHQGKPENPIVVRRTERFSIAMRQNISARQDWTASVTSRDIVRAAGTSTRQSPGEQQADGAGYTEFFIFEGVKPGNTRIVFSNRCGTDKTQGCYSPQLARTLTYRITVH